MREKGVGMWQHAPHMPVRSSFIIAERALLIRPQRLEQQIGFLRRDPPIGDHAQNGGALIFARRTRRWRSLLRRRRLRRFIGGRRGIGRVRDIDPDRCAGRRFGRVRWFRRMGRVRRTGTGVAVRVDGVDGAGAVDAADGIAGCPDFRERVRPLRLRQ
jgi:hypothetical protein